MADLPDWMQDGSTQTTSSPQPQGALPDWMNADTSGPAKESVRLSQDIAPDHAVKVLNIAGQTGLPTGFVSRNADALQKQADNAAITPQFSQDHPVTTAYVGEDAHQAAVAGSDIPVLGAVERQFKYMANQTERGGLDVERQFRGMLKGFGYDDPANDQRITDIQGRLQGDLNKPAPGPISNVFGKVAESAPMLAGALGIGAAASAASLPALAAAGGTAAAFGALEFGNSYLDFSQRKDAAGNPAMTSNEARGFSLISGALNGAMFMVPAEKMLSNMPGLRMLTGDGLRSLVSSPSALQALRSVAADIGKTGLTMGGFSGMSSLVHSVAGHLGEIKGGSVQPNSPSEFISTLFPPEDLEDAAKSFASGTVTGGIVGAAEGGIGASGDYRNYTKSMEAKDVYYAQKYKQAQDTAQGWTNIGNALQGTKMADIAPAEVDKLVSRMAPDSHVYIPMEHWQSYWEGQKADPRATYLAAVGNTKSYDESMRTGADLQIPAGKYASSIATSDHAEFFNNVLRADPLAMSAEEAKQSLGITKEIEKEKEDAASKIKDSVMNIPEPLPTPETEPITPAPAEIHAKEAQTVQGQEPLFPRPTAEGMSIDMAGKYRRAIEEARGKAQEDIARSIIDQATRQKSIGWLKERSGIQNQVEQEAKQRPEYQAMEALQSNTDVAEEFGLKTFKLNKKNVEEMDPTGSTRTYPSGMMTERGGLHPDDAAHIFGYNSGAHLLFDLKTSPKFDDFVKQETDERMMQRHPEISGDNIVDKAMDAVHNQDRSKVLRLELQHLASDDFAAFKGLTRKIMRRLPSDAEMKADVEKEIGEKTTAETSPGLYQRAEATSSREAKEHYLRGDFEKAFEAKLQELRNHELYRAAKNAKEQTTKDMAYQSKFDSTSVLSRIGKAGGTFLEQIQDLRSRFDFSQISLQDLDKKQSLREWYEKQKAAGEMPQIPDELLNDAYRKSWREMSNDELHRTVDSMRSIDHLSGLKKKLLDLQDGREYAETMQMINSSIDDTFKLTPEKLNETPDDFHPGFSELVKGALNSYGGWRTRMEPLFRLLGGGEYNNPLYKETFARLNDSQDFETKGLREATEGLNEIFDKRYSNQERSKFGRLIYVPELEGSRLAKNLNRMEIMISLAHAGCGDGMKELMRGYNVSEDQLRAAWKHLDPKDIETVQKMYDLGGSHWDDIRKQARKYSGLEPEKVPATPLDVESSDGSTVHLAGGYYHLDYDQNIQSRRAKSPDDDLFGNSSWQTMTKPDYEKARIGGGGQAPSLKFTAFTNNLLDTVHNLAYRDSVTDLYKIVNDPDFKSRVQAAVGKGVYKQFSPWIKEIAGDRPWDPVSDAVDVAARHMTTATLGMKVTSAFVHTTSFLPAMRELNPAYMTRGLKEFYSDPSGTLDFIRSKSEFMASRYENFDRDWRAAGARLNIVNLDKGTLAELKALSPDVRNFSFALMKYLDIGVAAPTWQGAYLRSMEGKVKNNESGNEKDAVSYADQLVRDTKGSGAAKDLAPIQLRNAGGIARLITMFYTQLSVIDNQLLGGYRQFKVDRNFGKVAATAAMSWFGPAIASNLIRGNTPKSDESWMWWGTKAVAKFPLDLMFGAREALNFFERAGTDFKRGRFEISALEEAAETVLRTAGNMAVKNPLADKLRGDDTEWSDTDYADAAMTAGYMTGLPTRQIVQSAQRLHAWMSGAEQHDNPMAGLFRVTTGTKKPE